MKIYHFSRLSSWTLYITKEGVCNCTIIIGTNFEMSLIRADSNKYQENHLHVPISERTNFQILVKGNQNQTVVGKVKWNSKYKPREQI